MGGSKFNEHGLTDRQDKFVRCYVLNAGQGTLAAIEAGYAKSSARCRAYEMLGMEKVQARMENLSRELMSSYAPGCLAALNEIAIKGKSDSVRVQAAATLLDRSGYKAPIKLEIDDHRTTEDVDKELAVLLGVSAAELGVNDATQAPSGAPEAAITPKPRAH